MSFPTVSLDRPLLARDMGKLDRMRINVRRSADIRKGRRAVRCLPTDCIPVGLPPSLRSSPGRTY